jgi:hypothetical protein
LNSQGFIEKFLGTPDAFIFPKKATMAEGDRRADETQEE